MGCDYSELLKLRDNLQGIKDRSDEFINACAKELTARLLRKVIKRTPVGDYSHEITVIAKRDGKKHKKGEAYTKRVNPTGKMGGTLRRGWTAGTAQDVGAFVNSLEIKHLNNVFTISVTNSVDYASYVETGHRQEPGRYVPALGKRLKKSWVPGLWMLRISEKEINSIAPALIEKRLGEFLKKVFGS